MSDIFVTENGVRRKLTQKEMELREQYRKNHPEEFDPAPPTEAERLAALENQLAGIVSAYREGVNNA